MSDQTREMVAILLIWSVFSQWLTIIFTAGFLIIMEIYNAHNKNLKTW